MNISSLEKIGDLINGFNVVKIPGKPAVEASIAYKKTPDRVAPLIICVRYLLYIDILYTLNIRLIM